MVSLLMWEGALVCATCKKEKSPPEGARSGDMGDARAAAPIAAISGSEWFFWRNGKNGT